MTAKDPGRKARKRGAGEGSIYQRPDGRWTAALMVGRHLDGKPDRRVVYAKTRTEVVRKLDELRRQAAGGVLTEPYKLTVAEFLAQWLRDSVIPARRAKTVTVYRSLIARQIGPRIGTVRLAALRPAHVQAMYAAMLAEGLSASTVRLAGGLLHTALAQAVRWRYLATNVTDSATLPAKLRREMATLSAEQVRSLLDSTVTAGDRLAPLWRLLAGTGCRIGEALALRWQDIDLERGTVAIRRTLVGVAADGRPVCNSPKTARSSRTVSLTPATVAALRTYRAVVLAERLRAGANYIDHGLVFPTPYGGATRPSMVNTALRRALKRAGLPQVRVHDLRHTMATVALEQGINPRVVADRLGHGDVSLTLRVYSHVTPSMERDATDRLAAAFGG